MVPSLIIAGAAVVAVLLLTSFIITTFLRSVDAGEILLASRGRNLRIFRGPCKALIVPVITQVRSIPAQAINVDIEITDQTADIDASGRSAPVKVTVRASAIVSVGEDEAMVNTAANKFFSKSGDEQLSTLTDVLSSAGRRAINLLKHDQLFNARSASPTVGASAAAPAAPSSALVVASPRELALVTRSDDDELAVIIKDACSRELLDLGLSFNSLNIKAVLSEVADARRRESAARAKADADVVQAQEEQRARIAQLEAAQKINDQERALNMQIASNGAAIARAEAEKQAAMRQQREAELAASQITQARADAEQNVIQQEAEGRAQAARIRAIAEAEAAAIRMKAEALVQAGGAYLDLRRLELAPELTREVAAALANSQFVNFSGGSGGDGHGAVATGSDDVLRVVQTLMAAKVITGDSFGQPLRRRQANRPPAASRPAQSKPVTDLFVFLPREQRLGDLLEQHLAGKRLLQKAVVGRNALVALDGVAGIARHVHDAQPRVRHGAARLASERPLRWGMTMSVSSKSIGPRVRGRDANRVVAVLRGEDAVAGRAQHERDELAHRLVVLDDEQRLAASALHARRRATAAPPRRHATERGKSTSKRAPRWGWLSTRMCPPACSTMPYTVASPRPVPLPTSLVVKNGSKMRARVASSMPTPSSSTVRRASGRPSSWVARGSWRCAAVRLWAWRRAR